MPAPACWPCGHGCGGGLQRRGEVGGREAAEGATPEAVASVCSIRASSWRTRSGAESSPGGSPGGRAGQGLGAHAVLAAEARRGDLVQDIALAAGLLAVVLAAAALAQAVEHLVLAGRAGEACVARGDLRLASLQLDRPGPPLRLDALEEGLAREQLRRPARPRARPPRCAVRRGPARGRPRRWRSSAWRARQARDRTWPAPAGRASPCARAPRARARGGSETRVRSRPVYRPKARRSLARATTSGARSQGQPQGGDRRHLRAIAAHGRGGHASAAPPRRRGSRPRRAASSASSEAASASSRASVSAGSLRSSTGWRRKPSIAGAVGQRGVEQPGRCPAGRRRSRPGPPSRAARPAPPAGAVRPAATSGRDDLADQARDALQHVDRRVVAGVGERAREHDVPVEDRARGVGDRLVHVVAVDQHRVERRDRAARRSCRRARAGAAAGRTRSACSRAWRAARRSPGRPRAGPSRSA